MLFCSASRFSSRSSVSPSSGAKARRWLATATAAVVVHVVVTVAVAAAMPAAAAVAIATIAVIAAAVVAAATKLAASPAVVLRLVANRFASRPAVASVARAVWAAWALARAARKLAVPRPLPKLPPRLPRPSLSVAVLVWSASAANWLGRNQTQFSKLIRPALWATQPIPSRWPGFPPGKPGFFCRRGSNRLSYISPEPIRAHRSSTTVSFLTS